MPRFITPLLTLIAILSWALAFATEASAVAWFAALVSASAAGSFFAGLASEHQGDPFSGLAQERLAAARAAEGVEPAPPAPVAAEIEPPKRFVDEFVPPAALDPAAVTRALYDNAAFLTTVLAAHIWLWDDSAGRLRLVACEGPTTPSPSDSDQGAVLNCAMDKGTAVIERISRITSPAGTDTVWRYAVPVDFESTKGVAAVDIASEGDPDPTELNRLFAWMRLPLASALALYAAQAQSASARALVEATRDLSRNLDPDAVIRSSLDRAMKLVNAATGSVMLLDAEAGMLSIAAATGLPHDVVGSTKVGVGDGIAGWVAASRQPVLVEDLPGKPGRGQRHGIRSAVSVPIMDDDGLLGVLNVGSKAYPARFTDAHMEALELLGRQTAVALRNARAVSSAGEIYFETLRALALALETKDPYARGGTERIMGYATALAQSMGLSASDQHAVEIAAMLHDVGMAALGEDSGSNPRPLSTIQRGLLTMHPVIAADILEEAPALRAVAPIVYHHHEHFDGSGYVGGLAAEEIPIGSRILAVADAYVAMTSARPYRRSLTQAQARLELQENAGTQFDPEVVQVFVDLLDSGSDRVPHTGA